jgi:hypothetical protein
MSRNDEFITLLPQQSTAKQVPILPHLVQKNVCSADLAFHLTACLQEVLLPASYDGESAVARRYRECALTACCSIVQRCYEKTFRGLCCDVLNALESFLAQSHAGFAARCGRIHTAHLVVPLNLCEHSTMSAMVKAQLKEKLKGVDRCVLYQSLHDNVMLTLNT